MDPLAAAVRAPWPRARATRLALAGAALAALGACAHRPGAPAGLSPGGGTRFALELKDRGRLLVEVPAGWTATPGEPEPPVPASVRLDPPSGHFVVLITPLWDPEEGPGAAARPEAARTLAELARSKALELSVERELPLRELPGVAAGWWFAATDREVALGKKPPGPDEFRCLVQGAAVVGRLLVAFTLLDDGDGPQRAAALDLVRRTRHEVPAATAREGGEARAPGAPPPGPAGPLQGDAPVTLAWPGKGWAVALDLPGFRMQPPVARPDAGTISVVGEEPQRGLVASIVLSEAGPAPGAQACADRDLERIATVLPDGTEVRRWQGAAPRADYFVATLRGERVDQQNGSAWRWRDGVCVHVHVSLMGWQPEDQPLLERILATLRYDEAL